MEKFADIFCKLNKKFHKIVSNSNSFMYFTPTFVNLLSTMQIKMFFKRIINFSRDYLHYKQLNRIDIRLVSNFKLRSFSKDLMDFFEYL